MRHYGVIVLLLAIFLSSTKEAQSASVVAIGVNAEGKVRWAIASGGKSTEQQTRSRAIGMCMAGGVMNPKIIASTSRRGFGAVLEYQRADGKVWYTASVGAATQQGAVNEAAQKAKSAGGRKAKVVRTWDDIPETNLNL